MRVCLSVCVCLYRCCVATWSCLLFSSLFTSIVFVALSDVPNKINLFDSLVNNRLIAIGACMHCTHTNTHVSQTLSFSLSEWVFLCYKIYHQHTILRWWWCTCPSVSELCFVRACARIRDGKFETVYFSCGHQFVKLCNRMPWLIHIFNWILKRIRCIASSQLNTTHRPSHTHVQQHSSSEPIHWSIQSFIHFDHGSLCHCYCWYYFIIDDEYSDAAQCLFCLRSIVKFDYHW